MDYILNRRSVRKYDLSKKLSYDELYELCKYGASAPSARRQSSREYIIVDDEKIINELSKVSKGSMILTDCNTLIAVVGKNPEDLPTPHMQAQDLAASTENILLASTMKGIGSCWIGVYPIEDRITKCNEILNVSDEKFVFSLIALGYPKDENCFHTVEKLDAKDVHHNGCK